MIGRFFGRWTMLVLLLGLAAGQAAAAAPPIEAFGRLPSVELIKISPDGTRIAVVAGSEELRQIQVRDLATLNLLTTSTIGTVKVRDLRWAGGAHLLVTLSETAQARDLIGSRNEWYQVFDLNLTKNTVTQLLRTTAAGTRTSRDEYLNAVAEMPQPVVIDGRPYALLEGISFPTAQGVVTQFKIDLEQGRTEIVERGTLDTIDWIVDGTGRLVARVDYVRATNRWSLLLPSGAGWREVYSEIAPIDLPGVVGFGRDARSLLLSLLKDDDRIVRELSLATGELSDPIEVLGDRMISDPRTLAQIGFVETYKLKTRYRFHDAKTQRIWDAVVRFFGGEDVDLVSVSDDRSQIVVRVAGEKAGVAYHRVNLASLQSDLLANAYGDIAPGETSPVRVLEYAAADGLSIPAFLTLPKDVAPKGLPLVVLVHGGPAASDEPGFDWWAQAMASRGYAVLQPQFRGSTGSGLPFMTAGYGEWGRKMQTDVSDGVRRLVADGVVDPKRVCIVGASYGGYAALAGAVQEADLYRCAVSVAGPSDLGRMQSWVKSVTGRSRTLRYWDRFMGPASQLDAISPALHADKVTSPVLIIHGSDDIVVPFEQSQRMADALKRAGKPFELVRLKGEDHWLSSSETRLQMLRSITAFLERNNPPGAAP